MKFLARWASWINTSDMIVAHWLRAAKEALLGEMPVLAAGTALFAIISMLPVLAAVVSIYGLVADPHQVQEHVSSLRDLVPPSVLDFLHKQLQAQAERSSTGIGIALAVSIVVAIWSARGAARAMVDSLNRAYRVRERRGPLHRFGLSLAMAAGALIGLVIVLAVTVALPGLVAVLDLKGYGLVTILRWPVLMAIVFGALLALYRFAPSPRDLGTERHLWPGALVGTLVMVAVSIGLSQYVERVARYDMVYGTFGSVIVVLLWFYLSIMALVIGGFVNAELERHDGAAQPDRSMY